MFRFFQTIKEFFIIDDSIDDRDVWNTIFGYRLTDDEIKSFEENYQ